MLKRVIATVAILVMLPSAASASSFKYYGPHMGFMQSPDMTVLGGQLQWNGVAPRMAFVPGVDYGSGQFNSVLTLNGDFHYQLTNETKWQPYVGGGVGVNMWRDEIRPRNDNTQAEGHLILGAAVFNKSGGRFFTEMKLGLGDTGIRLLAGWNMRAR